MSYRDLRVWQEAMELVEGVYRVTRSFPTDERFGLISQLRRAAVAVPSNIAEGQGRRSPAAFANHVNIARGSVLEVETQLRISLSLQFAHDAQIAPLLQQCDDLSRMLRGLSDSLGEAPDARRPTPDGVS